jgi:ESF2/ABP1 family protein
LDPAGFSGPKESVVKPLNREELAAFKAAQERAGIIYISRIPPGMQPAKVRHFMSAYGEVGRVYLQQEDAKRAYLRRKYTSTKKPHFTEGWIEFKDKKVARSVAEMLNAQPIGGKKGTRWRDDVWTMKYLPKFKWNMLTEQVAHENAVHTAKLRVELSQSRSEQQQYLRNVELARVVDKRAERKREKGEELKMPERKKRGPEGGLDQQRHKKQKKLPVTAERGDKALEDVLANIF